MVGDVPGEDLDTAQPCQGSSRVLQVAADDGDTYNLGYGMWDADNAPLEFDLNLNPGDRVQLELLVTIGYFYAGYALVLRESGGMAAVISDNKAPPLGELSVKKGDQIASVDNDCGEQRGWELVFTGDDALSLTPVDSGDLTVDGSPMTAYALAAWDWGGGGRYDCTDRRSFWEWAVIWRP